MRVLSKSRPIAFRQCPKRLWLEVQRPELREDSAGTLASFQVGHQVGDVARRVYNPASTGSVIDIKAEGYDGAFARSAALLADSQQPIFEAGFKAGGAMALADVMLPAVMDGERAWRMVEVKSATGVKDYHRDDVAVQAFIARASGVKLQSVAVACIDGSWVYPGAEDYRGLLKETDLTAETLARADEVAGWIGEAQRVVALTEEPGIAVGAHCQVPFSCGFCGYCNRAKPQPEYPVDWLPGLSAAKRGGFLKEGIDDLRAVADELLTEKQRMVKGQTLAGTVFFDEAGATADLAAHGFPAYFLNFETIQFAVPIWRGTRPYQQIPFQFSLHVFAEGGSLAQRAFLDLSGGDPSASFARALIAACGASGPVFVYNAGFETARIHELAARYPEFADPLVAINARVVDLLPVARNRFYHPAQQGSWSIKAVLPAAVPELSYETLAGVKDGGMAMSVYCEAIRPDTTAERRREIEQQLRAYCRLDTFGLVRLWQFFTGRNAPALQDTA